MEEKHENQCVVEGCELKRSILHNKCVVHCAKGSPSGLSPNYFANQFNEYLKCRISSSSQGVCTLNSVVFPHDWSDDYDSLFRDFDKNIIIEWKDCSFNYNFLPRIKTNFTNCSFNNSFSHDDELNNMNLSFINCTFNGDFKLEHIKSLSLYFQKCRFKNEFIIFDCSIEHFTLLDSNFNLSAKISQSSLGVNECIPRIINSIFTGILSFELSKFPYGLHFDSNITHEPPNFRGIDISSSSAKKVTSRETYRIIKFNLDSVGNIVEANKYFALEMDKLYSELSWKKNLSEKFLLSINKYSSNFGQNWWLPIVWMIVFASLFYIFRDYDPFDYSFLNGIASFIIPYQGIIGDTHQMSKLLCSILFGVLFYQTTVALKRKTRR
ncbi:hypothetical protein [Seleniivibrio woodruffii]|uniref:Pentapeptide repeat protein n=1 Tax=Seleniivibrio woodruffii TaxID=1078050 RepID=A0A4R1KC08_9BACT|nr:hypothetical protein [Seleniivibrio woodruffii]TCK61560.1 hypothetical protein C8D98_0061 [Seleniivibrio woodruffii]TVZ35325.1 hypothetical protein OF66_0932 [Seleniivibrio woodruffii]